MKERGDNMRILVISDSHGQLGNLNEILKEAGKVDRVIHLGDAVGQDEEIREMCGCPVTIVRGNCDLMSENPLFDVVEVEKNKIFIKMFAYIRVLPYTFTEVHPFCKTCCILPLYAVQ